MWLQLAGLAVGVLGVAASANWLVRGHARRVSAIRAEADLLPLLPDGQAKEELTAKVETDVLAHVDLARSAPLRRIRMWGWIAIGMSILLAIAMMALALVSVFVTHRPLWLTITTWALIAVVIVVGAAAQLVSRRADELVDEVEDAASQGVRIARFFTQRDPSQE